MSGNLNFFVDFTDDEKSSNQVSEVDEEEFHYEVIKKPMIGAGVHVGQMKDKIKGKFVTHASGIGQDLM